MGWSHRTPDSPDDMSVDHASGSWRTLDLNPYPSFRMLNTVNQVKIGDY